MFWSTCHFCYFRYECVCVPGITGKNCETNINECDSNPCSKYGTCNDGVSRIYYLPLGKISQAEKSAENLSMNQFHLFIITGGNLHM